MKSLSIIGILSVLVLTGCYPAYNRGYSGYSSGYSTGYGVQSYSGYPASAYYRQSTVPSYSYRYSAPSYDYGRSGQHYNWDRGQNRHDANRHSQDRWQAERNSVGAHHPRAAEMQSWGSYSNRDALSQSVPHANNYGQRSDGRGEGKSNRGGSRQGGGFDRHQGHEGRR